MNRVYAALQWERLGLSWFALQALNEARRELKMKEAGLNSCLYNDALLIWIDRNQGTSTGE